MKTNKYYQQLQEMDDNSEDNLEEEEILPDLNPMSLGQTTLELVIGIVLYGMVVQLIILIPSYRVFHSIGLWLGIATAGGLAFHMMKNVDAAVDYGENGARRHMVTGFLLRFLVVVFLFYLLYRFQVGSIITAFIGVMSLKIGAYLQPYIHEVIEKRR